MLCFSRGRRAQHDKYVKLALPEEPAELTDPEHELPLHSGYACFWSDLKAAQAPNCPRVVPHVLPVKALHRHVFGLVSVKVGFVKQMGKSGSSCKGVRWVHGYTCTYKAFWVHHREGRPHLACAQHIPDQGRFCHLSQGAWLGLRPFAVAIAVWRPMRAVGRPDILLPCCTACNNLLAGQMRMVLYQTRQG